MIIEIGDNHVVIRFPHSHSWHCLPDEIELADSDRQELYSKIIPWDGTHHLEVTTSPSMATTRQTIMTIEARRDGLELVLDLKIDGELENFIRHTVDGKKTTSDRWKDNTGNPLQFYTQTDQYKKVISSFYQRSYGEKIFDDFGSDLLNGTVPNVAPLRIVGLTEGVSFRVTNLVSFDELRQYVERLAAVVRMIYREFLRKESVKIMLTLDV